MWWSEVAERLGVNGDTDAALSVVVSADAGRLDAVLVRDSLWARLWPHIRTEPVFGKLSEHEKRRFSALADAALRPDAPLPRRLTDNAVVRRAIDIVAAHRVLTSAFGRAAEGVSPIRVSAELDLVGDRTLYEVLVILYAARIPWHTVSELPALESQVGLPSPAQLNRPCFETTWETAAFIDPVKVLPFMHWCMKAWAALPAELEMSQLGTKIAMNKFGIQFAGPTGETGSRPRTQSGSASSRTASKRVVIRRSRHLS